MKMNSKQLDHNCQVLLRKFQYLSVDGELLASTSPQKSLLSAINSRQDLLEVLITIKNRIPKDTETEIVFKEEMEKQIDLLRKLKDMI
jgi:hypothetical protein